MLSIHSRSLTLLLCLLVIFTQYVLWSQNGGLSQVWKMQQSIAVVQLQNKEIQGKNAILAAEVEDLKHGNESIEEHARMDLGMVKKNEIFYQVVK